MDSLFSKYNFPKLGYIKLPKVHIPDEDLRRLGLPKDVSSNDYMQALLKEKFQIKLDSGRIPKDKEDIYRARLELESKEIIRLHFTDYMLLVYDVIRHCKNNNILNGPSRGSCGGSLLLMTLDCIAIDPIKHNLLFERFISSARTELKEIDGETYIKSESLPDFDLDTQRNLKFHINEYLDKEFPNRTAGICNISTFQSKAILKEVYKCYEGATEDQAKEIANLFEVVFGKVQTIDKALKENEKFAKWAKLHPQTVEIASQLYELAKNVSVHASGIVVCNDEIDTCLPLQLDSNKDIVCGYTMEYAQMFGIKFDNLGVKVLDVIKDCLTAVGKKIEDVDVNDKSIYDFLNNTNSYYGIFQAEEALGKKVMQQLRCRNVEDLSLSIAVGRPGSMGFLDSIIKSKESGVNKSWGFKAIDDVLKNSYGVIVYQEQIMALCRVMAKFTPLETNQIRKCVSGDTMFVSKTRGHISIDRLLSEGYKDDLFLVMDECGKQNWKKIRDIWSTGNQRTHNVKTRNGLNVNATQWHQFLTNAGWKARQYLNQDDFLVTAKCIDYDGCDLITEDLAIVIAGLVTEGYFIADCSSTFTNFNWEVMDKFIKSFEKCFGRNYTLINDNKVLRFNKKEREEINKYLLYGKSLSKALPDIMMGMTKETTRKFLSFILTCEGGIIKQGKFEICSKSKKFADQIKLLLLRFGIRSCFFEKINPKYGKFYYINIGEHDDLVSLRRELSINLESIKIQGLDQIINDIKFKTRTLDLIPVNIVEKYKNQYGFETSKSLSIGISGSAYSKPLSRDRFKKIVNFSNDKYWIDLAMGYQEYSQIDEIELSYRSAPVYDFTIDDENTPYILANGIVIHNCVGKKLKDQMQLWKGKFINQSIENGFSREVSEEIWKTFDASGDYLFNASHSCGYAYMTATCAYLKANHPKEFYLALLKNAKHEAKPMDEINTIARELTLTDIKLLPPSILDNEFDFHIKNNTIISGLSSIKGIGAKVLEKISHFQCENMNKFSLFSSLEKAGIGLSTVSILIACGCFDEILGGATRSRLILEFQLWSLLDKGKKTPKEKPLAIEVGEQFGYNLNKILKHLSTERKDEKGNFSIKPSRLETLRKHYKPYHEIYEHNKKHEKLMRFWFELKFLGWNHSIYLIDIFQPQCGDLIDINSIHSFDDNEQCHFVGIVEEFKSGKSREKKTPYIKLLVADQSAKITCMMFDTQNNASIQECKENNGDVLPDEGDIVVVRGQKKGDCVFAKSISIQDVEIFEKISQLKRDEKPEENQLTNTVV